MKPRALLLAALAAALLAGGWGCAYYNTFFSARRTFSDAQAQTKAAPSKEPPASALALYDKCMEKCAKVITVYPKSRWVDDAILLIGRCYYEKRDYTSAIQKGQELLLNFPKSNLVPEARLLIARASLDRQQYDDAVRAAEEMVQLHPKDDRAVEGRFLLGEAKFAAKDYRGAIDAWRALLRRGAKGQRAEDARFRIGDAFTALAVYDSAVVAYRDAAARSRSTEADFRSRMKIGESLDAAARPEEAYETYRGLLDEFQPELAGIRVAVLPEEAGAAIRPPGTATTGTTGLSPYDSTLLAMEAQGQQTIDPATGLPITTQVPAQTTAANPPNPIQNQFQNVLTPAFKEVPRVALLAALALATLERPREAIEALERVVLAYPRTPEASEAQFRIGFLYEMDFEDFVRAKQAYDRVAAQGASVFTEQAAARSKDLATLTAAKAAVKDSTAISIAAAERDAEKAFLLAEFYLFQQERQDRALAQYETVEKEFPRSRFAGKSAFARAWVTANLLEKPDEARVLYRRVVDRYPKSEYSARALEILEGKKATAAADSIRIARYMAIRDSVNRVEAERERKARADSLAAAAAPRPPDSTGVAGAPPDSAATAARGARGDSSAVGSRGSPVPGGVPPDSTSEAPRRLPPGGSPADSARAGPGSTRARPDSAQAPPDSAGAPADSASAPADSRGAPADTTGARGRSSPEGAPAGALPDAPREGRPADPPAGEDLEPHERARSDSTRAER